MAARWIAMLALLPATCALHAQTPGSSLRSSLPMQKLSLSSDSALLRGPSKAVAEESAKSAAVERLRGGSGKSPASFLWNETVELTVYFALWYWGNTYCKLLPMLMREYGLGNSLCEHGGKGVEG
eukprot:755817-Hanusia_phi.AAC.1